MVYEEDKNPTVDKVLEEKKQLDQQKEVKENQARKDYVEQSNYDKKQDDITRLIQLFEQKTGQQQEDIDAIKQQVTQITQSLQPIVQMVDQHSQIINQMNNQQPQSNNNPASATGQAPQMDIQSLAEVIQTLGQTWQQIKGQPQQAPSLIDQDFINNKMKETFLDNLETGESINQFIKNSLKKSVTRKVIDSSLRDIGKSGIEHSPA